MASVRRLSLSATAAIVFLTARPDVPVAAQRTASLVLCAPASLATALGEIARQYDKGQAGWITLSFGATGVLARKISDGAPVDLFISDDEATMRLLEATGRVEPGTRVSLLSNQLVIVVPGDRSRQLASAEDLKNAAFRRIAIADPTVEPTGIYARRYLQVAGIWHDVEARIVLSATVREAVTATESGKADAAIVFRTDIRGSQKVAVALSIPRDRTPGIVYQAAVMRNGTSKEAARAFLNYLRDREARGVFQREGFVTLVGGQVRPPPPPSSDPPSRQDSRSTIASTSISTNISGETRRLTSTSVDAGRMFLKNSP